MNNKNSIQKWRTVLWGSTSTTGEHTALSLAKYLGKKFFIERIDDKKFNQIETLDARLLMKIEDGEVSTLNRFYRFYPILKTVGDLTQTEFAEIFHHGLRDRVNDDFLEMDDNGGFEPIGLYRFDTLMAHSAGAKKSQNSPTGYVSIFDNLPCKRWSECFDD